MKLALLEIPAQPEFVSVARLVVSSVAGDRYELSDDQLESLKLAVSEACVMAIQNRQADSPGHVAVECIGGAGRIDVTIGCQGSDFGQQPVVAQSSAPAEGEFDHDFGLPLIGSLVDEFTLEEHAAGNRMHLVMFSEMAEEL